VPAFDEAAVIERTLCSVLDHAPALLEIIVVDDGSSDADGGNRAALLATTGTGTGDPATVQRGQGRSARRGYRCRKRRVVVTLDADTRLTAGALSAAVGTMQRRHADAVAFYIDAEPEHCLLTRLQRQEYVASLDFERAAQDAIKRHLRAAWGSHPCSSANGYCAIRSPARTRTEDADLTLTLVRHGARIVRAADAVTCTLVSSTWAELIRQRTRWITGHIQCCAWHAAGPPHAGCRFRLVVFPNFLLSTFIAPAGFVSLLALWADGGARLFPLDAWGASAVSIVLVYLQRGIGVLAANASRRPALRTSFWSRLSAASGHLVLHVRTARSASPDFATSDTPAAGARLSMIRDRSDGMICEAWWHDQWRLTGKSAATADGSSWPIPLKYSMFGRVLLPVIADRGSR
jgi:hypothetical protein